MIGWQGEKTLDTVGLFQLIQFLLSGINYGENVSS